MTRPTTFAEAEVNLAKSLPGYESRSQQQALAGAVEDSIADKVHLIAEAGCGTGKSLGYMIPAILSGKRVVVSTATKALQDQVASKDLPFLAEHLGAPFTFALLKGRSNYICGSKVENAEIGEVPSLPQIRARLASAAEDPTFYGERDDLGFEVTDMEWSKIAAETDDCSGFDCKNSGICYADRARRRAADSNVVVVNHALYLVDMVIKRATYGNASLIGPHDVVIFDESHELEEYASKAFGATFREGGVRSLSSQIKNFVRRSAPDSSEPVDAALAGLQTATMDLWAILESGRIRSGDLLKHGDEYVNMANALADLLDAVMGCSVASGDDAGHKRRKSLINRTHSMMTKFHQILTASFDDLVRWVDEEHGKKVLKSAPINVGPDMAEMLFDTDTTAILTSATMSVRGKFDYIASRLGIESYQGIDVGTPFSYADQSVLYVPTSLPDPSKERAAWSQMATQEMYELVAAAKGRSLLLFTSVKEMRSAYESLSRRLPYTCLIQGEATNKILAEQFTNETSSVLFATKSFMTGVDFQGETCSLVVVNKMPFPVPTEPVTEARCESIQRAGGSDFGDYTIPVMTLTLKQAFGRLIRHRNDQGVVAILDPRLQTKGYGKGIVKSLPDSRLVTEFSDVSQFLGAL